MFLIDCDVIFKELIIYFNVCGGILMVIYDYEKINILFCIYLKMFFFLIKRKKDIYVICIFCKLEKNIFGRRSLIYYLWYLNFLFVKKGGIRLES